MDSDSTGEIISLGLRAQKKESAESTALTFAVRSLVLASHWVNYKYHGKVFFFCVVA